MLRSGWGSARNELGWAGRGRVKPLLEDNLHDSRDFCLFYTMINPGTESKVPPFTELIILVESKPPRHLGKTYSRCLNDI